MIETDFPFKEFSKIAAADRRARDPVYSAHRWWARRPPGLMRGILLAASLPADTVAEDFWSAYEGNTRPLQNLKVHDPFVGGGSTLVEAARLGAIASGTDVDPLAVAITSYELNPAPSSHLEDSGAKLLSALKQRFGRLLQGPSPQWTPLHYFYIHEVECRKCTKRAPLYRTPVIAKDTGRHGAVVRNSAQVVFCPDCFELKELGRADQKWFTCCRRVKLNQGTYFAQRFSCPHCGTAALHSELQTGAASRRLIAIEETSSTEYRRIRQPRDCDLRRLAASARYIRHHADALHLPEGTFTTDRVDQRPLSFGITQPRQLFTDRQLCVFGSAFAWVNVQELSEEVKNGLRLALSNALATNNKLCGYATEYGRIAPLFSVRSYSLPALAVELNPLHPTAGRGTIARSIERVARTADVSVRRYSWSPRKRAVHPIHVTYNPTQQTSAVHCEDARMASSDSEATVDLCVFDPPYFDYISYSELSEFYRFWSRNLELGGEPLLPRGDDRPSAFGKTFGVCLQSALHRLKPRRPIAFTFHSADPLAWKAVDIGLGIAGLLVTAMWPVRADGHMGHHTEEGNCEWDIVVVCRRAAEVIHAISQTKISDWTNAVRPLKVSEADRLNFKLALEVWNSRRGTMNGRPITTRNNG
ncbi:DUF1156 domain-containing protein [Pyxidicoccus trucidator]|uniref:DUF1156 domain-containing protein n=1 Tax=Pyxidicoccus trucidator TaxID=2709662 RepID=UPI00196753FF|nr:DUF1156 domain-containing protein [Pyxidicoccus trucidator]